VLCGFRQAVQILRKAVFSVAWRGNSRVGHLKILSQFMTQ
jgi:hypothetical protein